MTLFLAVTVMPTVGLIWLGAQLFTQDQDRARQQLRDRLDLKATDIATGLRRDLETPPALSTESGALLVTTGPEGVRERSGAPLLFHPTLPVAPDPSAAAWLAAEVTEEKDLVAAGAIYRRLARTDIPAVRAGALVRLARTLRRAGQNEAALLVYDELTAPDVDDVFVFGDPASLVASLARTRLLEVLRRPGDRAQAAAALRADLERGRWRIDGATFVNAWAQVDGDPALARPPASELISLAKGVELVWREWRDRGQTSNDWKGRRSNWIDGHPVTLVWYSTSSELTAFVAGPHYFEAAWRPHWHDQGLEVALVDNDGKPILGAAGITGPVITRAPAETGLPWTVRVSSAAPAADLAEITTQRRRLMLVLVLSLSAFLVLSGAYFVARSVRRELAVARLRSDFVSAVSHELRTPLTSIGHLIELLRDPRPIVADEARRSKYYDALAQEASRLHQYVETLLDFGRIESGNVCYEFERLDPATLITDAIEEFRTNSATDDNPIELSINGPVGHVQVDRHAFGLALKNLIDNAVKYSPSRKPIWLELDSGDGRVVVRVRDSGSGIPRDEQSAVFDKFVRGAAARKSGIRGSGVGLAVARQIVRAHGGDIELVSEPGTGSTFTITLPAS